MADPKNTPDRPPYVSFKTFTNFVQSLRDDFIPDTIDTGVLGTMSGANKSALLGSLHYLGLIKPGGEPTDRLRALVNADTDEAQSQQIDEMIRGAYSFIFNDGINLATASGAKVVQLFRDQNISGSTVSKSMTFFLAACKTAGIEVSKHVKPPSPPKNAAATKKKKKKTAKQQAADPAGGGTGSGGNGDDARSAWQQALLEKFPEFNPEWGEEAQAKWFDAFNKLMDAE